MRLLFTRRGLPAEDLRLARQQFLSTRDTKVVLPHSGTLRVSPYKLESLATFEGGNARAATKSTIYKMVVGMPTATRGLQCARWAATQD